MKIESDKTNILIKSKSKRWYKTMKTFNPTKGVCKSHKEKKLSIFSKVFRNHKIRARKEAEKNTDASTSGSETKED